MLVAFGGLKEYFHRLGLQILVPGIPEALALHRLLQPASADLENCGYTRAQQSQDRVGCVHRFGKIFVLDRLP
jgi:hypothetical protein